jgi:1-acyl-sn-glycerol-3-phosphate acyltransferase
MWRLVYVVGRNLYRLPGIIGHMRKLIAKESYSEKENYAYLKWITNEILRTGHIRVEGHGMEHLPQEGGYLMCPNHQGKLDAYAIVAMHDNTCTVVMDEAKSYTIFIREIIDMMRGKRLELNNPRKAVGVIKAITEEVAAGRRYILFPESGYTKEKKNSLIPFKAGCFKISVNSKMPIVPVVLVDTYKAFNSLQLTPVTAQVHFLPPIYYEEFKDLKTVEIASLVQTRIQQKLDELLV